MQTIGYSTDTRKGVIMLKEMMYDMNPELCVAPKYNSNGDMDCTLESNACQGSCVATREVLGYHTVTASKDSIQPLDWQGRLIQQ